MPETLSASRIAAAAGGFEPQRVNNFLLYVTPPSGDAQGGQVITWSMRRFPFPKSETEVTEVPYINSRRKAPGRTNFAALELVLTDYVDQETARILSDWRTRVFDPVEGITGLCKNIKVEATLVLFAPDGTYEREWTLVGLWPSAINFGDGNMDVSDGNLITVTLQVDYWFPKKLAAAS